jgi:hypothetical protein
MSASTKALTSARSAAIDACTAASEMLEPTTVVSVKAVAAASARLTR